MYSQPAEAVEYRAYLEYLGARGYVTGEVEELALEELQGVKGLRALRVAIDVSTPAAEVGRGCGRRASPRRLGRWRYREATRRRPPVDCRLGLIARAGSVARGPGRPTRTVRALFHVVLDEAELGGRRRPSMRRKAHP